MNGILSHGSGHAPIASVWRSQPFRVCCVPRFGPSVVRVAGLASELQRAADEALLSFQASLASQGVQGAAAEESASSFKDIVQGALTDRLADVGTHGAEVVATAVSVCMQVCAGSCRNAANLHTALAFAHTPHAHAFVCVVRSD